ncbi:MAG: hypothetical protein IJR50_01885 [Treponema sp.]|nr:hypothetical protein [Treponema sp.]
MKYVALCLYVLLAASCATTAKTESYRAAIEPYNYHVRINALSVVDDSMKNDEVALQIQNMLDTHLLRLENEKATLAAKVEKPLNEYEEKLLNLDVVITQRSFIKNMEEYNSIYAAAMYADSDGKIIAKYGLYKTTKNTVASSVEQHRIVSAIASDLHELLVTALQQGIYHD